MSVVDKLKFNKTDQALVFKAPPEFDLSPFVYDSQIKEKQYKFLLAFVRNKSDIDTFAPDLLKVSAPDAIIWMAYPKKSSAIASDISRDKGWISFVNNGYRPVAQVSLDEEWSALRFRPVEKVKASPTAEIKTFKAVIQGADDNSGGTWIDIPYDVKKTYGTKGQVKIKATFDGYPYRGSIANMGNGHMLLVRKDVRKAISKTVGDSIMVTIQKDTAERTVQMPDELKTMLNKNKRAYEFYNSLSYTNRKEYADWISSAKREETKQKRLTETLNRLNKEIKNPFVKG